MDGIPDWQGAEARVYLGEFGGHAAIYKQRFSKSYRHPLLDTKLNTRRMTQEARCMAKALRNGIRVPTIYLIDPSRYLIVMEKIQGCTVKTAINEELINLEKLAKCIGKIIAELHNAEIIHGDLTTSNLLLQAQDDQDERNVVMIDFGLAMVSKSAEDRAVDLYVLERAINSTHPTVGPSLFVKIIDSYRQHSNAANVTLNKLAEVQLRGRKRDMTG